MKKFLFIVAAVMMASGTASYAQSNLTKKERKALTKQINAQVKDFNKEGWQTTPGSLPLSMQFAKAIEKLNEDDENGNPVYITGEAMSIGANYDGAKLQALELAKQNLAGTVQTEITALVENTVSNKQLEDEEAATIVETVSASKNLISQSLGRVITLVECYRTKNNKNKEVYVRIAYNSKKVQEIAKKIVKDEIQKKGEDLHKKLDAALGW